MHKVIDHFVTKLIKTNQWLGISLMPVTIINLGDTMRAFHEKHIS